MSNLLLPLSWLYALGVWLRNRLYDAGIVKQVKVSVPVISVGNMVAGGTGKTPMVEYLVRYFTAKGKNVAVLSRGYKRTTSGVYAVGTGEPQRGNAELLGDELFQLARKFPLLTVIAAKKRAHSAQMAIEKYGANVLLLDDGFQHRSLQRDVDIVMLNGNESLVAIPMLPAGVRREPVSSLRRADVLAYSGSIQRETEFVPKATLEVAFVPKRFEKLFQDAGTEIEQLKGKTCIAFCGIANPQRFRTSLESLGVQVKEFIPFPDHHPFSETDVQEVKASFEKNNAEVCVTTEKDAMRLLSNASAGTMFKSSLYFLAIELQVIKGEQEFQQLLEQLQ